MKRRTCTNCEKTFANRHNLCRHKKKVCKSVPNLNLDITTSKICNKKLGEKQPHCNEIIHFSSDEFKDSKPKTMETLNKITEIVNRELLPPVLLPAEKKIGMGTSNNAILAAPAIGFVDGSVPGRPRRVPGHHSLDNNELKEILKPIHVHHR